MKLSVKKIILLPISIQISTCILSISYLYFTNNLTVGLSFLLLNYILAFWIVNIGTKNLFNISTYFLLGFGALILGRIISKFMILDLEYESIELIFCMDFFFNYCMRNHEIAFLCTILNLTIISFSLGHIFTHEKCNKNYNKKNLFIPKNRKKLLILALFVNSLYLVFLNSQRIYNALLHGYMILYQNQAEIYQTPIYLLLSSLYFAGLATLYIDKQNHNKNEMFFIKILLGIFVLNLMITILTGGRGGFINAILFLIWLILKDEKISYYKYSMIAVILLLLFSSLNVIAALSGARGFRDNDTNIWGRLANNVYEQGVTLMVFNSSLSIDEINIFAYLKTILPGIQIIYPIFNINDRYLFDWASLLAYKENPTMYEHGFGLGWSILSDFYLLSFQILPLYFILFFLFGFLLKFITIKSHYSKFQQGVIFIVAFYIFSIPRNSISPLIFCLITYLILYNIFLKARIRQ